MLAMISCSAARSTSVTKSLRPLEAMVSDSRRFMLRTITSPARRAARTAMLSSGCMMARHHSNARGAAHVGPLTSPARTNSNPEVSRAAVPIRRIVIEHLYADPRRRQAHAVGAHQQRPRRARDEAAALQRGGQQRLTADGDDFRDRAVPRSLLHDELHERLPCLRVFAVEPAVGQPRLSGRRPSNMGCPGATAWACSSSQAMTSGTWRAGM